MQDTNAIDLITDLAGGASNRQLQDYLQYCWLNDVNDNQRGPGYFISEDKINYLKASVWDDENEPPTYERRIDHAIYLLLESVWQYRMGYITDLHDAMSRFRRQVKASKKIREIEGGITT